MTRADVKARWIAEISAIMKRYSGCTVALQGGRGLNPKQLVAEIRAHAREAVRKMIAEGVIPSGICSSKNVMVTIEDATSRWSIKVDPPATLAKWWDEKIEN